MTRIDFLRSVLGGGLTPFFPLVGKGAPSVDGDFPDDTDWLEEWNRRTMLPIVKSDDPVLARLADSVRRESRIEFRYFGGSEPGRPRSVTPLLMFTRPRPSEIERWLFDRYDYRVFEGGGRFDVDPLEPGDFGNVDFEELARWMAERNPAYLMAWCHEREAKRCFRVDRMEIGEEKSPNRKWSLPMPAEN